MWSMSSIMYSSETSHKSSAASLFTQESYNIVKREFCMAGFSIPPLTWAVFTPQKLSPVHCWRASSGGKYTLPCQSEGWEEQLGCPHKSPWVVCSVFGLWGHAMESVIWLVRIHRPAPWFPQAQTSWCPAGLGHWLWLGWVWKAQSSPHVAK